MDSIESREPAGSAGLSLAAAAAVVDRLAKAMLKADRYAHSARVADTAAELFPKYGLDPAVGRLAGIAHDLCKNMERGEQKELAAAYRADLPAELYADKRLVHGPAAAAFLSRNGLVDDPVILDAIAYHSLGKPGMSRTAMALYAADKLEPGRSHWRDDLRQALADGGYGGDGGLEALVAALAAETIAYVRSQGWDVAPGTLILYNALTGKSL